MKRSTFIRNSFLVAGGGLLSNSLLSNTLSIAGRRKRKITILHTNDTHSNIDPFPENDKRYANRGGVSRRLSLIQKIRAEEENVLLLDAGDIFQGTPYFNLFGGTLEMKLMSKLGYDLATMGNHDFDGGMDGFVKALEFADFDFVCSNYDFSNTPINGLTKVETVIEKDDIRIGVFGLGVELSGLVPDNKFGETIYYDPIEIAQERIKSLEKQNCDLIICLSHLGYGYNSDKVSDKVLAEKTDGIHLIIGGHTHTFLDEPTQVLNKSGKVVLINQVGFGGLNLGRIDFEIDGKINSSNEMIQVG